MPWIESNPRPEPIQMTGEAVPSPFRTWKNDVADVAPYVVLALVATAMLACLANYGASLRSTFARIVSHLRTPVK
jgi:hypothetical protein